MRTYKTCLALAVSGACFMSLNVYSQDMQQQTLVSKSLRFVGDEVGTTASGDTIREVAIYRGKKFLWQKKLNNLEAEEDNITVDDYGTVDIEDLSVEELAENIRGIAFFSGASIC